MYVIFDSSRQDFFWLITTEEIANAVAAAVSQCVGLGASWAAPFGMTLRPKAS